MRFFAYTDTFTFASKGARGTAFLTDKGDSHAVAVGVGETGLTHPWHGVKLQTQGLLHFSLTKDVVCTARVGQKQARARKC